MLTTCLVAVAIPAAAGTSSTPDTSATSATSATPPGIGAVAGQLSPSSTPTPTPSPSASAAADTGSTTAETPAAAARSAAAPSDPAACLSSVSSNPTAVLTCLSGAGAGGANPLTGLIAQLQGVAAGGGAPGLSPAPFTALAACLQGNLTTTPPDGTKLESCFSTFAEALTGAPQAKCLDPLLQGAIGAVQALAEKQDPSALEAFLTGAPGTVTTLVACLQGASSPSPTPTPTPTPTTGTTTQSGGATTDPTTAVPVSATPTFTG
jgi:hypothetical protein